MKKAQCPSNSTPAGIDITVKAVSLNAPLPIRCRRDPFSKVIFVSDLHVEKQQSPISSTVHGIAILLTPVLENAERSIRCRFVPLSNETEVIFPHE
jgi:hypothetical protein